MDANTVTMEDNALLVDRQRAEEDAKQLYAAILQTAMLFLHSSKHFSVDVLAEENPTYEAVADLMTKLGKMIWAIADDFDPLLSQKAFDYCNLMKEMGIAISKKDQLELSRLTAILDKRHFI